MSTSSERKRECDHGDSEMSVYERDLTVRSDPFPNFSLHLLRPQRDAHLLDLQLMDTSFISNPSLLQIQVQSDARLGTRDLLAELVLELLDFTHESIVFVAHELNVLLLEKLELGFELGKIDVLSISSLCLSCRGGKNRRSAR